MHAVNLKNSSRVSFRMSDEEVRECEKVDLVPQNNSEYSTQQYWDWRYEQYFIRLSMHMRFYLYREAKNEDARHYDWIMEYSTYKTHLLPLLKPSDSILMVGCGNSSTNPNSSNS